MIIKRQTEFGNIEIELSEEETKQAFDDYLNGVIEEWVEDNIDYRLSRYNLRIEPLYERKEVVSLVVKDVMGQMKRRWIGSSLLKREIDKSIFFAATELIDDWRLLLLLCAGVHLTEIPRFFDEAFEAMMQTMTEREKYILETRFRKRETYEKIGVSLGITRERVRQIEHKTLRKIREGHFGRLIDDFTVFGRSLDGIHKGTGGERKFTIEDFVISQKLSTRASTVIHRAGFRSTDELVRVFFSCDCEKIRNCGKKTIKETRKALCEYYGDNLYERFSIIPEGMAKL